jgi:hypothetical protein
MNLHAEIAWIIRKFSAIRRTQWDITLVTGTHHSMLSLSEEIRSTRPHHNFFKMHFIVVFLWVPMFHAWFLPSGLLTKRNMHFHLFFRATRLAHLILLYLIWLIKQRTIHHEKRIYSQVFNKFPKFFGTRKFITMFATAHNLRLSWARWISYTSCHPIVTNMCD